MSEAFVPLVASPKTSREGSFVSLGAKDAAPANGAPNVSAHGLDGEICCGSTPVVTLQRDGDKVTGIRVQCGCGQIVDLSCVY